jgi:guanylate kinase
MTREEFLNQLPILVGGYQPLPEIRARIASLDLVMIVGATGVGKTSIIKRLGVPFVITDTTRPIRPNEINGSDYNFRTDYDQLAKEIKERQFVQFNIFPTGDFYGTKASAYPDLGFAVYAVVSNLIDQMRHLGFNETMTAFIVPPTFEEWMRRIDHVNMERDQLAKRLEEAEQSFKFALHDEETHFILNDEIPSAVRQIKDLLNGKIDKDRETLARRAAELNYGHLIKPTD